MKRFLYSLQFMVMAQFFGVNAQASNFYDLSLLELAQIKVKTFGTLTKSDLLKVPASVTRISNDMIRSSGARNLDELLELYVPNFQRAKSGGAGPHFGMRGIVSDLDNKTLMLVNGKVMNDKTRFGALAERHMPLLGDIAAIEVVRGPGSAIYGPGAINGVISIETFTPMTFDEGSEIHIQEGIVEEFNLVEFRHGYRFSADAGIFFSLGVYNYDGASPKDSPLSYSKNSTFFSAGEEITDPNVVNDNTNAGNADYKLHLHFQQKDFELWLRSTRAGIRYTNNRHLFENNGSFVNSGRGLEYQQDTLAAKQQFALSNEFFLILEGSFDTFSNKRVLEGSDNFSEDKEDELNLKTLLGWDIDPYHSLAVGLEYSRERFTLSGPETYSDTSSLMTEYQWNLSEKWTIFAGGRVDKHSYTDLMYSPKMAVVFSPDFKHQLKLIFNHGTRKSEELELQFQNDLGLDPEIEKINSFEFRHDWQINQQLTHGLTYFYYEHAILGFLPQEARETTIGTSFVNGMEFELTYKIDAHELSFSHAYTKLLNFELRDSSLLNQVITSEPYGYGDDLQNWSNHISKLNWAWLLDGDWRLDSNVRVYWGYQGAEDYTAYNNEVLGANNRSQSDGRTDAFDASVFLNTGLNYQVEDNMRLSLNLYNILGWIDNDLNKRNFYGRMAGYRREAAAASLSFEMRF